MLDSTESNWRNLSLHYVCKNRLILGPILHGLSQYVQTVTAQNDVTGNNVIAPANLMLEGVANGRTAPVCTDVFAPCTASNFLRARVSLPLFILTWVHYHLTSKIFYVNSSFPVLNNRACRIKYTAWTLVWSNTSLSAAISTLCHRESCRLSQSTTSLPKTRPA